MFKRSTASLVVLALASALALPSCLIGSNNHTESSGTYVSSETFERVQPGQSEEFVTALLGAPDSKIVVDGAEEESSIWKWSYSSTTTSNGSIFLLVRAGSTKDTSGNTFVEFSEGKVVKAWRD